MPFLQANGFKPHLLECQDVLPPDLIHLVNLLAETAHNKWAKEKIDSGWIYGLTSVRDVCVCLF